MTNFRQWWGNARPTKTGAFWIAIGAIVLAMFLGFSRGGWKTENGAMQLAESFAKDAVVERLKPICVAQFNADDQRVVKLEELKEANSFQRTNYVKEQGWATMPGETDPDNQVAIECAKQLALIGE